MAEEQDDAQKTEDPTQKRIEDAKKKGDVAKSQEVRHWFMMMGILLVIATIAPGMASALLDILTSFLEHAGDRPADGESILQLVRVAAGQVLFVLAVPLSIFVLAAIGGNVLQALPVFTMEKMKPKLQKISPLKGLKRMFSSQSLVEFLKSIAKVMLVGAAIGLAVMPFVPRIQTLVTVDLVDTMVLLHAIAIRIIFSALMVVTVIAVLDFAYQKMQQAKKLRMTKQEVRDEHKQMEGDPHVKARLRQIRMERARQRMMAAVPDADVVVTNPTHYAVALKYDQASMAVPILVAKGVDSIAEKIREVAEENGIPFVENPPLARALYATVELDEEVPSEHYEAVAKVISYIFKLRREGKGKPRQRSRAG